MPDYTKFDKRLYRVPDDQPYYHGTQAKEFESVQPGTHVTPEYKLAKGFASAGSFTDGDTGKDGRVIEFRVGVPNNKAPRISFTKEFLKDVDDITDKEGNRDYDKLTEIVDEYNRQADHDAKEKGYSAYYTGDLIEPKDSDDGRMKITGDLRILDPETVRIIQQDLKRPKKAKEPKSRFNNLANRKKTASKKSGRGEHERKRL